MPPQRKKPKRASEPLAVVGAPEAAAATSSAAAAESSRAAQKIAALAQKKIHENFRILSNEEADILLDPASGLTLRERLVKDLTAEAAGLSGENKHKQKRNNTTKHINNLFVFVQVMVRAGALLTTTSSRRSIATSSLSWPASSRRLLTPLLQAMLRWRCSSDECTHSSTGGLQAPGGRCVHTFEVCRRCIG